MKILTLSNSLLEEAQGSGYIILGYARRFRDRGHHVDALGPRELEIPRWGSRAHSYRQMLGMAAYALRNLGQGYDVYEFYGGEAWLAVSLLQKFRRRPLLVAHSNGLEPHAAHLLREAKSLVQRRWYQFGLSALYARGFRLVDALVTVSEFDRAYALTAGYLPVSRVIAIENPLLDEYLHQPLVHERPRAAVYCGSWAPQKGATVIARDAAAFLLAHTDWKLVLVGVGEGFRSGDYFAPHVARRIEVVPSIDREHGLRAIYRGCRIAIQASPYESFGLAAAEAMACGCALVASRVGFASSLVDGQEALLFPSAVNPDLAACLARLAGDEQFRRLIATNGYRRVQNLRWDTAVERLESSYASWVEHRKSSS